LPTNKIIIMAIIMVIIVVFYVLNMPQQMSQPCHMPYEVYK